MDILGISAYYHDAAAALVRDGEIVAAAQEERFSRVKHDSAFPAGAVRSCLEQAEVDPDGLDLVAYFEKPLTSFARVLRSFAGAGTRGLRSLPTALHEWGTHKLWTGYHLERGIRDLGWAMPKAPVFYAEHHQSHAASAFFPSPFESAAVLTFDGVGEWATSSIGHGTGARLELLQELRFPHSIGLLYSAFTFHAGFRVNSGEYKLMGLAPYGEPRYVDRILEDLVDLRPDGSFTLDQRYFSYLAGRRMTNAHFDALFDGPPRLPEAPITRRDADLARSVQEVVERIVLAMSRQAHEITGEQRACLSGGVALNCVANARLVAEGPFDDIWVQPASGDAGSAVGCALAAWYAQPAATRSVGHGDGMGRALLGPASTSDDVAELAKAAGWSFVRMPDADELADHVAELLDEGSVVGLFQGRAEFGPRALGNRSIVADPRRPDVQRTLNLKIKQRESFRPFAPAVLAEEAAAWFALDGDSPYMLLVAPVRGFEPVDRKPGPASAPTDELDISGMLDGVVSPIPAVTHIDGSARVQTVDAGSSPGLRRLLEAFRDRTGCPVLVNTSFNVRGEPIVGTPEDAYRCFMTTEMDWLVIEDCMFEKVDQPPWTGPAAQTVDD